MCAPRRCRARRVLLALLAAASSGCGGKSQQECVPCVEPDGTYGVELKGVVAAVEEVQVGQPEGTTAATAAAERRFQLAAWYIDVNDSIISGRFDPFLWKEDPAGAVAAGEFGRIAVRKYDPAPVTLRVTSPDGAFQDEVALRRWDNEVTAAATEDVVVTGHRAGSPPSVVLVEEQKGGQCKWGRAWAFVGIAAVGQQDEEPCSLTVLSADHAMIFQDPAADKWVPSTAQTAPAGTVITAPGSPPREVAVMVFIAVTSRTVSLLSQFDLSDNAQLALDVADAAEDQARADVTRTNMIFEANRVGIRIKADYKTLTPAPDLPTRVGAMDPFSCNAPRALVRAPATGFEYDPAVISVYYVDWIDFPAAPQTHPGASGYHCAYHLTPQEGPVIFISYTRQSTFTLAHEIGHALMLEHPAEGTLDALNLMHGWLDDGPLGADARSRLTVGQAVRMNIENESWMSQLTGPGPVRLCWPSSPCPSDDLDAR